MRTNQTKTLAAISTLGIRFGKATLYLIGLAPLCGRRRAADSNAGQRAAVPDRHGGVLGCPLHRPAARA